MIINPNNGLPLDTKIGNVILPPYNTIRPIQIIEFSPGSWLLGVLLCELGKITYDKEQDRLVLGCALSNKTNSNRFAMSLLGNVAEAVLVKRCYEDPELNRRLLEIARRKETGINLAKQFVAIATGLQSTKRYYLSHYNPHDTQKDIIWISSDNNMVALVSGSNEIMGIEAGIQVKTSLDGMNGIYYDLIKRRYAFPIIYFPLGNDYEKIFEKVIQYRQNCQMNCLVPLYYDLNKDFIDIRSIDPASYNEVRKYYLAITELIEGKIYPADLIHYYR